jgi:hypothetical protein
MTDSEDPAVKATTDGLTLEGIRGGSNRELIASQLSEERSTKDALEQRGLAVVTTSGALATLLFGVSAFATQAEKLSLSAIEVWGLIAGLTFFVVASVVGLLTARPRAYEEAGIANLQKRVDVNEWYRRDPLEAYRLDTQINVDILAAARTANKDKASLLFRAIVLEVVGIFCVAVVVALVVSQVKIGG